MTMDLVQAHNRLRATRGLTEDVFQSEVVVELQSFAQLVTARTRHSKRGLYLWGPVGRGKTMLMDLFFENFDGLKTRFHFHEMMRWVRDRLAQLSGTVNPLSIVASEMAPPGHLVYIDEFHVSDIDNALVIEVLLKELVSSRTVIVTTSNFSPDDVIDDALGDEFRKNNRDAPVESSGLFRASKAETLRLLKERFRICRIGGSIDYRTSTASGLRWFVDSDVEHSKSLLERRFAATNSRRLTSATSVFGRPVICVARSIDAMWFEYREICEGNYSYRDYLELLKGIRLVVLEDVKVTTLDGAKRFAWLVEVIYDSGIALMISAPGGLDGLFRDVHIPMHLRTEMLRVRSRVVELANGED
jgi:cell division protein ZapE